MVAKAHQPHCRAYRFWQAIVSFLAINALFRLADYKVARSPKPFENSFVISGFVPLQANDRLRSRAEALTVIFRIDEHFNIIVITAYSENDETW